MLSLNTIAVTHPFAQLSWPDRAVLNDATKCKLTLFHSLIGDSLKSPEIAGNRGDIRQQFLTTKGVAILVSLKLEDKGTFYLSSQGNKLILLSYSK